MAEKNDIVTLAIVATQNQVSREGFGTALVVAHHNFWADDYRIYTSTSGLTADSIPTYHPAYRKVAAAFSQVPRPKQVILAKKTPSGVAFSWTVKVTSATEGQVISFDLIDTLSGAVTAISRTIPAASSVNAEATAVELLTEAVTGIDSTVSTDTVTLTPASGTYDRFYLRNPVNCEIKETTADADYDDFLSTFQLINNDWYYVLIDSDSQANVNKVAAWVLAATRKIYFTSTNATDELTGTGTLGATLKTATSRKTVLLWANDPTQEAAAAYYGMLSPRDPGSINTAFKTLLGVSYKALTPTQRTNLTTDNINHYEQTSGLYPGVTASGEWVDVVTGTDALEARIQDDLIALFKGQDKVRGTDIGGDQIRATIIASLRAFEGTETSPGLLKQGSSSVIVPAASERSAADKTARRWSGITFAAEYEDAVNSVGIQGTITF